MKNQSYAYTMRSSIDGRAPFLSHDPKQPGTVAVYQTIDGPYHFLCAMATRMKPGLYEIVSGTVDMDHAVRIKRMAHGFTVPAAAFVSSGMEYEFLVRKHDMTGLTSAQYRHVSGGWVSLGHR